MEFWTVAPFKSVRGLGQLLRHMFIKVHLQYIVLVDPAGAPPTMYTFLVDPAGVPPTMYTVLVDRAGVPPTINIVVVVG